MIDPIKAFASALTPTQLSELFSHYSPASFHYELENYEARMRASDPTVSIHLFRLSRILRDMLFTCPSIHFGRAMATQSKVLDGDFAGVHLYVMNQSMLTPLWAGAGMPYISVSHGSDHNYMFGGLFPEGEVSTADQQLAEQFVSSFARFAYTGKPGGLGGGSGGDGSEDWPALGEGGGSELEGIPLQVVGGPLGSGSCRVGAKGREAEGLGLGGESLQQVMRENVGYEGMKSRTEALRSQQLERENLVERCRFMDSLAESLGV